ncbi:MAG: HEAT repeat domain-containing protein [Desulfovibrio sp.]|nr:HEAT repeat domain-containing protein [Desulfovibrio sp.]
MARMRAVKQSFREYLSDAAWRSHLEEMAARGAAAVGPLFSFLPGEPLFRHRAAAALGLTCARLAESSPARGQEIVRRYMWHLSEESGNIGWGVPEAFGETLAASPRLAAAFGRILVSYVIDLGRDDNYCDNDVLRRSCYWAIGRRLEARPEQGDYARPWLRRGLDDKDALCRGMAAWALSRLPQDMMDAPALRRLADAGIEDVCILFDGEKCLEKTVSELAREALAR